MVIKFKLFEKESFIKSFLLFFIIIELFLGYIFYNYYTLQKEHLEKNIFLEMKNYSFFFKGDKFEIDIVPRQKTSKLYELYIDDDLLYILVPMGENIQDLLQIYYPKSAYEHLLSNTLKEILFQFLFLSFISIIISLVFSIYALTPMKNALKLLEEFIKDIIHDLNTPITSILINLKMIDSKTQEIQSIKQSAKTISMLYKNLDHYLKESNLQKEKISIKNSILEQITFFKSSYDYLKWEIDLDDFYIFSDKDSLSRIFYNLLSNACKYNTSDGFVKIKTAKNSITISNSSYGIKNPKKIFERFYKESERGVGIGLHIVDKLTKELQIKKEIDIDNNIFTIKLYF